MKELINQLPPSVFLFIQAALMLPASAAVSKWLNVAGTILNIPVKQIVTWLVSLLIGLVGYLSGLGVIADVATLFIYSFIAALTGNGVYDAIRKK